MKFSDYSSLCRENAVGMSDLATPLHTGKCSVCPLILADLTQGDPISTANAGEGLKVPRMETIVKTAEIFNLPVHFVRAKVNSGEVVAVRAGKKFLVNVDRFAEYLNSATVTQTAENASGERLQRIAPIPYK